MGLLITPTPPAAAPARRARIRLLHRLLVSICVLGIAAPAAGMDEFPNDHADQNEDNERNAQRVFQQTREDSVFGPGRHRNPFPAPDAADPHLLQALAGQAGGQSLEDARAAAFWLSLMDPTVKPDETGRAYRRNLQALLGLKGKELEEEAAQLRDQATQTAKVAADAAARAARQKTHRLDTLSREHQKAIAANAREHYANQAEAVVGREVGGQPLHDRQREGLAMLRDARVAELLQAKGTLNLLKKGTGTVTEGSFVQMPGSPLRRLVQINQRLSVLQSDDGDHEKEITALEAERATLLTIDGVRVDDNFRQRRSEYLTSLIDQAKVIGPKKRAYVDLRRRLFDAEAEARTREIQTGGVPPSIQDKIYRLEPQVNSARTAYLKALDGYAILTTQIEMDGFEGRLWEALEQFGDDTTRADKTLDLAIDIFGQQIDNEIIRVGEMNSAEDLVRELGSPIYEPLRTTIASQPGGPYSQALTTLMMDEVASAYRLLYSDETVERAIHDTIIGLGHVVLFTGMALFPPSAIVLGPMEITLVGYQVGVESYRTYVVFSQTATAESALASGGRTTHSALPWYEQMQDAQVTALILTIAVAPLDVWGAGTAMRTARSTAKATTALVDAATVVDDVVIPIPGRAGVTRLTESQAENILKRLDQEALTAHPRMGDMPDLFGAPGDAAFFLENGLRPQQTVRVGDMLWHVSAPFKGPGGRVAVIAFQEVDTAGRAGVIARTWYLSNEHGVWRVVPAATPQMGRGGFQGYLHKGSVVRGRTHDLQNVNEAAADLGAELQAALWRNQAGGLVELTDDAARRGFYGWVEAVAPMDVSRIPVGTELTGKEWQAVFPIDDAVVPFPNFSTSPGLRPAPGPLATFDINPHPFYQGGTGGVFVSLDGSTFYVGMRSRPGTFVPLVQDAEAPLTAFGSRNNALRAPVTTPMIHGAEGGYVRNPGFRNSLNGHFDQFWDDLMTPPAPAVQPPPAAYGAGPTLLPGPTEATGLAGAPRALPIVPVTRAATGPDGSPPPAVLDSVVGLDALNSDLSDIAPIGSSGR